MSPQLLEGGDERVAGGLSVCMWGLRAVLGGVVKPSLAGAEWGPVAEEVAEAGRPLGAFFSSESRAQQ